MQRAGVTFLKQMSGMHREKFEGSSSITSINIQSPLKRGKKLPNIETSKGRQNQIIPYPFDAILQVLPENTYMQGPSSRHPQDR